jgi:hypothetical protein
VAVSHGVEGSWIKRYFFSHGIDFLEFELLDYSVPGGILKLKYHRTVQVGR